jgi:hypothetical protein
MIPTRDSLLKQWTRRWGASLFLLVLTWMAHFALSRRFGFYGDDMFFSSPTMSWTWGDLLAFCRTQLAYFPPPQGRPIGFLIGSILPFIGYRIADVQGMYLIGFAIIALNAILLYRLLKRSIPAPMPLLAGIAFILFPGDTTRPFLTHEHILQPSLTFMLIASHMYLSGGRWRRVLSYAVAALCLLTYESTILPFLAIPLLECDRKGRRVLRWIAHMGVVMGVVMAVFALRWLSGETRAVDASVTATDVCVRILKGSYIGPTSALYSFWFRLTQGWHDVFIAASLRTKMIIGMVVFAVVIRFNAGDRDDAKIADGDKQRSGIIKALTFGIAALIVAYLFSFTHYPPDALKGGGTSVHLAAAIGAAALFAGVANGIIYSLRRWGKGWIGPIVVACYLGFLMPVMADEQKGYAIAWQERQRYVAQVIKLCPDLDKHTLIICQGHMPLHENYVPVSSYSDCVLLEQMYRLPPQNYPPPRLIDFPDFATGKNWDDQVQWRADGKLYWHPVPFGVGVDDPLEQGDTILLRANSRGELERIEGKIEVAGRPFLLRPRTHPHKVPFPTLPLYRFILQGA